MVHSAQAIPRKGFKTAVRALHAERLRDSPVHCTLEELEDYHRRKFSAERGEAVRDHLALCENCAILLLYGVIAPEEGDLQPGGASQGSRGDRLQLRPRVESGTVVGQRLASMLETSPLTPSEAVRIAAGICQALDQIHSTGSLIGDLRPESVLISSSRVSLVLDLHLSPLLDVLHRPHGLPFQDAVGEFLRTAAPERLAGGGLDQKSDLFSLGVLLYEMVTGVAPFRDSTAVGTAGRILVFNPPPARELAPEVPLELSDLIERLMAKERERRPPNAAAVTRELNTIAAGFADTRSSPEGVETPSIEDEIDRLYSAIIALSQRAAGLESPEWNEEFDQVYSRLRELQLAEATEFRRQFEASLNMPIDVGESILARARALRENLENLAAPDLAAPDPDHAPTPAKGR